MKRLMLMGLMLVATSTTWTGDWINWLLGWGSGTDEVASAVNPTDGDVNGTKTPEDLSPRVVAEPVVEPVEVASAVNPTDGDVNGTKTPEDLSPRVVVGPENVQLTGWLNWLSWRINARLRLDAALQKINANQKELLKDLVEVDYVYLNERVDGDDDFVFDKEALQQEIKTRKERIYRTLTAINEIDKTHIKEIVRDILLSLLRKRLNIESLRLICNKGFDKLDSESNQEALFLWEKMEMFKDHPLLPFEEKKLSNKVFDGVCSKIALRRGFSEAEKRQDL